MRKPMTIGRLAKAAGVGVETIRYYQRRGLLDTPSRPLGGRRLYADSMLSSIAFISAESLIDLVVRAKTPPPAEIFALS